MNSSEPITDTPQPLLRVKSVGKSFGGIQALCNVTFEVAPETIHAVIGPNGAGKTTLFNVITGAYEPEDGQIVYENREIQGKKVQGDYEYAFCALSILVQGIWLFPVCFF